MSTVTLNQPVTGPVLQGIVPISLPFPKPDSKFSLLINAPGVLYQLEAPIVDRPTVEDDKITARFVVDDDVYLDLNLIGQSIEQENKFKSGQFSLFYRIEAQRPRAHFVANTLMAVIASVGSFDLKFSGPEVSTNLQFETSLLEISKMLHRRQTAYRLMVIEEATGKRFLLPSAMSAGELERIAFVYHAIVDRSFTWSDWNLNCSVPATQDNATSFAGPVQPFHWSLTVEALVETVIDQPINLGRSTVTVEDAVVTNLDEVREQLEMRDGRQVTLKVRSLSGQGKYEFKEIPYSPVVSWEPNIQALIDLEPYLNTTIVERYHALAASTLEGLTEDQKIAITARPELDEQAF
jgi:hypothetical protein